MSALQDRVKETTIKKNGKTLKIFYSQFNFDEPQGDGRAQSVLAVPPLLQERVPRASFLQRKELNPRKIENRKLKSNIFIPQQMVETNWGKQRPGRSLALLSAQSSNLTLSPEEQMTGKNLVTGVEPATSLTPATPGGCSQAEEDNRGPIYKH